MSDKKEMSMPLIGEKAPKFKAATSMGKVNFPKDYKGKWVILFSHPSDFTPVCSTEFITFSHLQKDFKDLNTELLGLSIDSVSSHIAWAKSLESIEWKDYKDNKVDFPIIADLSMDVANKYGMIQEASATSTVRAVFIIDPEGIVRLIMYYPASVGRNFDEIKRALIALQTTDKNGVATPADWKPGDDVIDPNPADKKGIEKREKNAEKDKIDLKDWYLGFKKDQGLK